MIQDNLLIFSDGIIKDKEFTDFLHFNAKSQTFGIDKLPFYVFDNCDFFDNFEVIGVTFLAHANINFINCRFHAKSGVSFVNCELENLSFRDCTIKNKLYINHTRCLKLTLFDSNVNYLICTFNKISDLIIINKNATELNKIEIFGDEISDFELKSELIINELKIGDCVNAEINSDIDKLDIFCDSVKTLKIGGEIYNNQRIINQISFVETSFSGNIYFENIKCQKIRVSNVLSNEGLLSFAEFEVKSAEFEDVLIQNLHFNIVKFTEKLSFERSLLENAKLFNVEWLKDKQLTPNFLKLSPPLLQRFRKTSFMFEDEIFSEDDSKSLKYQRDAFRQLKAASSSSGNQIDALGFYKNEMRLYWKEIRIYGGLKWYDFILVLLNRITSDFGQNWFLPLLGLLIFHFFFVSCLFSWNYFGNNLTGDFEFGQFWVLINPVHTKPEYIASGFGHFTDIIMRFVGGYFIYHLIKASRKFGKNS